MVCHWCDKSGHLVKHHGILFHEACLHDSIEDYLRGEWVNYDRRDYTEDEYRDVLRRAHKYGVILATKRFVKTDESLPSTKVDSVSIIMTNYNRAVYLPLVLWSLETQFDGVGVVPELVFVDDNSHDGSEKIVEDFAQRTEWPTTVVQTNTNITWNQTLSANIAVKLARKELLLFNDADTVLLSDSVDKILRLHSKYRNVWLTPTTRLLGKNAHDGTKFFDDRFVRGCPIIPCLVRYQGASLRRRYWNAVGGFDENYVGWTNIDNDLHNYLGTVGVVFTQRVDINVEDFPAPEAAARVTETHPRPLAKRRKDFVPVGKRAEIPKSAEITRINW